MPSRYVISRIVCALGGLALAGCYSPYRYAPYSPYNSGMPMYSPQAVPVQPQFGTPTPVYPEGTFPPAGSTFGPGTSGGTLTPTPDPGASGTFPPSNGGFGSPPSNSFDPSLPPTTGGSGGGLVPNYGDPETLPRPNGTFGNENTTPFGPDGAAFQRDSSIESVSRVQFKPNAEPGQLQLAAHQTPTLETVPGVLPNPEVAQSPDSEPATPKPNPYGYDAVAYKWLRGIVDFDEQQKAWVLIYNPTPGPRDVYKGNITLIGNGQLRDLKNNQVILVEGQVDPTSCDPATEKPQYRVQKMYGPLVPKF